MIDTAKKYQLIDDYLINALNDEDQHLVDQLINSDPKFNELLIAEQGLHVAVEHAAIDDLRIDIQLGFNNVKRNQKLKKAGLITGALLLIAASIFLLIPSNNQPEKDNTIEFMGPELNRKHKITIKDSEGTNGDIPTSVQETTIIKTDDFELSIENTKEESNAQNTNLVSNIETIPGDSNSLPTTTKQPNATQQISASSPPATPVDLCAGVQVQLTESHKSPCIDDNNGKIELEANGGLPPYKYQITGNSISENEQSINFLEAGSYSATATDANDCQSNALAIVLEEKSCYEVPKAFNPNEEPWIYQTKGKYRKLQILSSNGQLIYETTGEALQWYGTNTNGTPMPTDSYIYLIFENDELVEKNKVTIVR